MDKSVALFGANLRRLIREREITESALAQRMKMAPAQLNRYMHGQIPKLGVVTRAAAALGVEPAELLMTDAERAASLGHPIDECFRRIAEAAGITPAYLPLSDEEWAELEKTISPEGVDDLRRILNQPRRRPAAKNRE